jgi:hypothetical protein
MQSAERVGGFWRKTTPKWMAANILFAAILRCLREATERRTPFTFV